MNDPPQTIDSLLETLKERAKELNCLYAIEELLRMSDAPLDEICDGIIRAIPPGWQYPDVCHASILIEGKVIQSPNFRETPWRQVADILLQEEKVGSIQVFYSQALPAADEGPFLKEEKKLIETIAERLGHFIFYQRMKISQQKWQTARSELSEHGKKDWQVVVELLRQTDKHLFLRLAGRMLNHLCWSGIQEAEELRYNCLPTIGNGAKPLESDENQPDTKPVLRMSTTLGETVFRIAEDHLSDAKILSRLQKWIHGEKLGAISQVVHRPHPLSDIMDVLRRQHRTPDGLEAPATASRGLKASLIRRILSDQQEYVRIAKDYVEIEDFYHLLQRVVYSGESYGRLGGKGAGLFLADQILRRSTSEEGTLASLKVPKTWYITSDMMLHFIHYNSLAEIVEQKYKEIERVRLEYPHVVQSLKNSQFPPELITGVSVALDDLGDKPLIVRSSSLLEDSAGAVFSGKYKSLFLANQGDKKQRLEALLDAMAEVYASLFGPDPIGYRKDRGLLDFSEQMGILIQEVVGTRMGKYHLPSFAGVALSRNEFRWSPRIKREDGLIRLVPGLGTRAVDRTGDDYPVLVAPGQPGLRVNLTTSEMIGYAPRKVDVINLETNAFETVAIEDLVEECGGVCPAMAGVFSIHDQGHIREPVAGTMSCARGDLVVTFDGLISRSPFVGQVRVLLNLLEEKLGYPVDIEFASDGRDFYLLQCRPQSHGRSAQPAPIPKDIPEERIVFTADRHVSNGEVLDMSHVVYVDPASYSRIEDAGDLHAVGRAIGRLNVLLPKRRFILMGPGRWGSRGDMRLGVQVSYSDISNTALLIEIARKRGHYEPDLSFGTHFFQDLVEADIRYLPLYPDDEQIRFNERFLCGAPNILAQVLPEFSHLEDTLRLIDVPASTGGQVLNVLMNAELDEAVGLLVEPRAEVMAPATGQHGDGRCREDHWHWRYGMAEQIATGMDAGRFGVAGLYLFGSTKNGNAGPASDIDLLIHFQGTPAQRRDLVSWLDGWSLCLDEMNYLQTGYRTGGLLDTHLVTDEDIAMKTSYAVKIGAVTDAARPLKMGSE